MSEAKYKSIYWERLKTVTPKPMPQRLPIAFAQVKTGKTAETGKIIYSLYRAKEIIKHYIALSWIQWSYKTEWISYLWILAIVKYLILTDYYSIFGIQ